MYMMDGWIMDFKKSQPLQFFKSSSGTCECIFNLYDTFIPTISASRLSFKNCGLILPKYESQCLKLSFLTLSDIST